MNETIIRHTYSICPICLKRLPALLEDRQDGIYLTKECPEHGNFSAVVWRKRLDFQQWIGGVLPVGKREIINCPDNCGICTEHQQGTCCVLYEVTRACNLQCRFCFADPDGEQMISLEQIKKDIDAIAQKGHPLLQLSGGEPTLRHDLPQIVRYAVEAGCSYVQLNSNGIKLAEDQAFVAALAEAGLSFVFMQFDGTNDDINIKLRGKSLLEKKIKAIENCANYNIGVTLVPTVVPGVNTDNIGDIIRFAIANSPAVRGVHFQPVSYFGRYPTPPCDEDRYTLDQLVAEIPEQTQGLVSIENLAPSHCDHPLCGFHGSFIVIPGGELEPLILKDNQCCCSKTTAEQNREYVGRRWQRPKSDNDAAVQDGFDTFLNRVRTYSFTLSGMVFQDCYNLNIERLRQCSLHVYQNGQFIPFCARYLTGMKEAGS